MNNKFIFLILIFTSSITYPKGPQLPIIIDGFTDTADSHDFVYYGIGDDRNIITVKPGEETTETVVACRMHYHNQFKDYFNTKVSTMRFLSVKRAERARKYFGLSENDKDYFVLTPGNLHYDSSIPVDKTKNSRQPLNEIIYNFDREDYFNINPTSSLKFNFSNITKNFKATIQASNPSNHKGSLENIWVWVI